ncbi:hypothetical protein QL093DRAFT_2354322 [Fusarium oxysporum]|nr:hypothetical protein QL093DRAFT_2354322 [Fusarium oxysporum]
MDWQRGHLALDVLVGLYIPRTPLHPRLASQVNVQTLTVSKITVDMFFQQWLKEARVAFESNPEPGGRGTCGTGILSRN